MAVAAGCSEEIHEYQHRNRLVEVMPLRTLSSVVAIANRLVQQEVWLAVPGAIVLIVGIDADLIDALTLGSVGGGVLQVIRIDRAWPLGVMLFIVVMPWIARLVCWRAPPSLAGLEITLSLHLLSGGIGYLVAAGSGTARARLLGLLGGVLLFRTVATVSQTETGLRHCMVGLVVSALIAALLTLQWLGFRLPTSPLVDAIQPALDVARASAFHEPLARSFFTVAQRLLIHANALVDQFMVVAMGAFALATGSRSNVSRLVWTSVGLAGLAGVAGCGSRGAMVSVGIVLFVGAMWLFGPRFRALAAVIVVMAFVIVSLNLPSSKISDLLQDGSWLETDPVLARLQVWSSYWNVLRFTPSLGSGLGLSAVAESYSQFYDIDLYFADPHAHNWLLQITLEQTIIGLSSLMLIIGVALGGVIRIAMWPRGRWVQSGPISIGSGLIIVALALHNMLEANLSTNVLFAQFMVACAIAWASARVISRSIGAPEDVGAPRIPPLVSIWFATAMTVLLMASITLGPAPLAPRLHIR